MKNIKYIKRNYFDDLINSGSVRIGTLKDYKEGEHGQMVADSMEGSKRYKGFHNKKLTSEIVKSSQALSSLIRIGDNSSVDFKVGEVLIIEPDYYIFSFAQDYNVSDHENWYEEEGYDAAYSIGFPTTFFKKITNKLNERTSVEFLGLFKVHYYNEKEGMDFFDDLNPLPAFSLKDYDGFSNQSEIRAVWRPLETKEISPVNLNVDGLYRYVELESVVPSS
ncbi:hypothetical protein VCR3J2_530100 [Vibrio coralliirubri]|uniref:hypothetical protein n=1 Tax=Vibrio coralliirubri TaxID=1516159 RepID=UPI000630993D|nr:hypothetical protein [Vibrio coralliirubri]CDU01485.1 hypothetical protein VCR3J2_530100 [Vibrio coralliirubri]